MLFASRLVSPFWLAIYLIGRKVIMLYAYDADSLLFVWVANNIRLVCVFTLNDETRSFPIYQPCSQLADLLSRSYSYVASWVMASPFPELLYVSL